MSRTQRTERARIFVGCEGESENGYAVCVANIARDIDLPVTIDAHIMKKGDPLSRIRWAQAKIEQQEASRGSYAKKFAFLDTDQREADPKRGGDATALAKLLGITIIWQEPDHEGLLLQHFEHKEKRPPRTKAESMKAMLKVWPGYEKGSTAHQYGRKIKNAELERGAGFHPELKTFLQAVRLIPAPEDEAKPEKSA